MAIARVKTWSAGEVLTANDLNNEFNNLANNVMFEPIVLTQQFDANGQLLILDADGDTLLDTSTNDTIDVTVAGADDFRITANTFTALSGSNIVVANGNITSTVGNLTVTDGTTTLANPDSRTNTAATPLIVASTTSGSAAAGIATGLKFTAKSADEDPCDVMSMDGHLSDVTAGSEDSSVRWMLRTGGNALTYAWELLRGSGLFVGSFTHSNTANRTYTLPDVSLTVAGRDNAETLTNKTLTTPTINSPTITGNTVGTGAIKTSTGSTTLSAVSGSLTMNDYSFSPSLTSSDGDRWTCEAITSIADPWNTVARMNLTYVAVTTTGVLTARWRYVTASDDPTMWVAYDSATGAIRATWASDDPIPGNMPGVQVPGMTSLRLKAQQLEVLSVLNARSADAAALIRDRRLRMQHQAYRALQLVANDDAPSKWLLDNCRINPLTGLIQMKP